jgi:casein kinase 1
MKIATPVHELTKDLPKEFSIFLNYAKKLSFEEKPDIYYCRKLFQDLFYKLNFEYDLNFEWMVTKKRIAKELDKEADSTASSVSAA